MVIKLALIFGLGGICFGVITEEMSWFSCWFVAQERSWVGDRLAFLMSLGAGWASWVIRGIDYPAGPLGLVR